jgi:L-arabinose isomerase
MKEIRKARVGLLGLMLEAYDQSFPELHTYGDAFARDLAASMADYAEVAYPGVCNTRELVDGAVASFESGGADLIVVVLLTYAPSLIALPALKRTTLPVLILNTQRAEGVPQAAAGSVLIENHGMHGVQDLANVLLRAGRQFGLVTGHWQDQTLARELQGWCTAARTANELRHSRFGLLGYPMQDMGDFAIDEAALLAQLGAQMRRVSFAEVARLLAEAPAADVARMVQEDHDTFAVSPDLDDEQHRVSVQLEWALRAAADRGGLDGLAIHFMAVDEDKRLPTLPFLAASEMLADGYSYGAEGDITCAAAVYLMRQIAAEANFTEMFTMDFEQSAIVMAHMGEGNWRMAHKDRPVRLVSNPFGMVSLPYHPVSLSFALQPGRVTLASLTTGPQGRMRVVVTEGQVLDFAPLDGALNPQYKLAPSRRLPDFLTDYSLAGGSHHQALAYGSHSETLRKLCRVLDVDFVAV